MADPSKCGNPSLFLLCGALIEFTPIGDARILVEEGANVAAGNTVDRIDVALATVGLGATALVPLTGGASYSLKIGSATIRVARKLGGLGGSFERALGKAADVRIRRENIGQFVRTRDLDHLLTDPRVVRELAELSKQVGTVATNAGRVDAVLLLKHVEDGADAAGLARVSRVAGEETRKAVELLGLPRAVRAVSRMSDLLIATLGLVVALVGQLLALASPLAVRSLRRLFAAATR